MSRYFRRSSEICALQRHDTRRFEHFTALLRRASPFGDFPDRSACLMKNKSLTRIQKDAFSKERLRWREKAEESKREKPMKQTYAKLFDKNM